MELAKYLFHEGKNYKSYNFMGCHLTKVNGESGAYFRVWAPNAKYVNVIGSFNNWEFPRGELTKENFEGLWSGFIPGVKEWDSYKYRIVSYQDEILLKSDPYAFYTEYRPRTDSIVINMEKYKWNDHLWQENKRHFNPHESPINIFEVHLGSWKRSLSNEFLNYRILADELVDYVKYMGYTHIEILPITEHPLDDSWGYQTTGYYSVTSRFGEPDDLKYFVDKFHQNDIGVILDWVPGHFCKDSHGLSRFDGSFLYEYDSYLLRENFSWGTSNFDLSRNEVKSFLISSAMFWIEKYHIDGIRVDAVSNMLYLDFGKESHYELKNKYGGNENLMAIEFLQDLNSAIFLEYPSSLMIAEESTSWGNVSKPKEMGGLAFNFKWNMGWMNDMIRYMELDSIYKKYHHNLITFSLMYAFSENFILPLSHDEVVHLKKSLIDKMPGYYDDKFSNLKTFYGYMMAHPGKKLLFMGGEFGQFDEWKSDYSLDWHLLDFPKHKELQNFCRDLNHLYKNEPALWQIDTSYDGFRWIEHENEHESRVAFCRLGEDNNHIIALCNFTPVHRYISVGVPSLGKYIEILNSDKYEYGGHNIINHGEIYATEGQWKNFPAYINVNLPPLATVYFKPVN